MELPSILKKTNKYVYLSDGTHMNYSDYHRLKQDNTNTMAIVHAKEFKNSIQNIIIKKRELQEIKQIENQLEEQYYDAQNQVYFLKDSLKDSLEQPATDWEKLFRKEVEARDKLSDKINKIAQAVYLDFESLSILKDFKFDEGIKFILQENEDGNIFRFRFDPYQMVANYHSSLSQVHQARSIYTVSGGWIRFIDDKIILYSNSGDYGSYDNDKAIEGAKQIFPNRIITSHPDKKWDDIKNLYEL